MAGVYLTVREVAERVGVSTDTVARWCRERRLPATKPGRDWRIEPAAVDAFVEQRPADRLLGALELEIGRIGPGSHVLVLALGGRRLARRVAEALVRAVPGDATLGPEPLGAGGRGPLRDALVTAEDEARGRADLGEVSAAHGGWSVRWACRSAESEARFGSNRATVLCVLPIDAPTDLAAQVDRHSHLLAVDPRGAAWSRSIRPGARRSRP